MLRLTTFVITVLAFSECSQVGNNRVTYQTPTDHTTLSSKDNTVTYETPTAQTILSSNGFSVKDSASSRCASLDISHWAREFHECFIAEKNASYTYDMNDIVDRMLEFSNDCLQRSKRCLLESQGFIFMMENVINEMKTYLSFKNMSFSMEKGKDFACIKSLSVETYRSCFDTTFEQPHLPESFFQKKVKEGLSCARERNKICSTIARDKLDDIVHTLLGFKQTNTEENEDKDKITTERTEVITDTTNLDDNKKQEAGTNKYITEVVGDQGKQTENADKVVTTGDTNDKVKSTRESAETTTKKVEEVKPTKKYTERPIKTTTKNVESEPQSQPQRERNRGSYVRSEPQPHRERNTERYVRPEPQPQPKRWYHYVFAPFISLWNAVKSFFGF